MGTIIRNKKLKVVSLFCGCGGMDLGVLGGFSFLNRYYPVLPFEIVYALDNDSYATKIYDSNFSHKSVTEDIKEIIISELPDHDILLGGFPCQSFSISAQNPPRLGYEDEKGTLFFEMVKILKEKQPRFFVAENVKGLLSANKKKAFPLIIQEFESAGYHIKYKVLNASEYRIPQKRERVFIMGFKNFQDLIYFNFPLPTTVNKDQIALKYVIDNNANYQEKWFFSDKAIQGMMRVREKMNKGREQNLENPCNTISSHLAKVSLNSTDPVLKIGEKYRRFTPRETANIQSFPSDFIFDVVSENRQYKAIGNAVPPVLMWHIADSLSKVIEQSEGLDNKFNSEYKILTDIYTN